MLRGIQYNIMDKKGTKRMGITIKLENCIYFGYTLLYFLPMILV